jgi:hypothetical protein
METVILLTKLRTLEQHRQLPGVSVAEVLRDWL